MTQTIIDKLERADGPSDELDVAIAEWCYTNRVAGVNYDPKLWLLRNGGFTYSIDAAMTLVPEGWTVTMGWTPEMVSWAHLESTHEIWPGNASTPALALCIAALRARSQGGE